MNLGRRRVTANGRRPKAPLSSIHWEPLPTATVLGFADGSSVLQVHMADATPSIRWVLFAWTESEGVGVLLPASFAAGVSVERGLRELGLPTAVSEREIDTPELPAALALPELHSVPLGGARSGRIRG